ncbi:MAG: AAA family ATPase [Gemmatimonadales bacterium]
MNNDTPLDSEKPTSSSEFGKRFSAARATAVAATLSFALSTSATDVARALASENLVPVAWRCVGEEKVPLNGKGWPNKSPAEALANVEQHPKANVGFKVAAWRGGYLVVVDIDDKGKQPGGGSALFLKMVKEGALPPGPRAITGNGWHLYFYVRSLEGIKQQAVEARDQGIDLDGKVELFVPTSNRWMALPPSVHPNGKTYQWLHADLPVPELPREAFDWLINPQVKTAQAFGGEGNRHNALWKALASARGRGMTDEQIALLAQSMNGQLDQPRSDADLRNIIRQVCKYPIGGKVPSRTVTGHVQLFSDIEEKRLSFFWPKTLPWGSLVLFAGEPDEAKSLVTVDLVSRASRGDALPDGSRPEGTTAGTPIMSLMVFLEDSAEAIVKPRLRVAQANQRYTGRFRMRVEGKEDGAVYDLPMFPDDGDALRAAIVEHGARIVVIDPITAFLGDKVNSWRASDVRKALAPLCQIAEDLGVLVICIIHVNKNENASALNRISESKAFAAVARVVYFFTPNPDGAGKIMAPAKGNWLPEKRSYSYGVLSSPDDPTYPIVAWDSAPGTRTAQEVLTAAAQDSRADPKYEAALLLWAHLKEGRPVDSSLLKEEARKKGINEKMLSRVAKAFGVLMNRDAKYKAGTTWQWPPLKLDIT